ncbi:hypothetical protein [Streptomyces sp. cmx-18-6]|uniref:hypothetical protein n=1 Tax=Streptomyces sp. cmx-18-6 TaxID=2790930 RepID=UPI00397EE27F
MTVSIGQLRISYVFTASLPALAAGSAAPSPAVSGFVTPVDYDAMFRRAKAAGPVLATAQGGWPAVGEAVPLSLPWADPASPHGDSNNFWRRSLRMRAYSEANGAQGWRSQVPLRPSRPVRIESSEPSARVTAEALCHPLANSVIVATTLRGGGAMEAWADQVSEHERGLRLRIAGEDGPARSIEATAHLLLERLDRARQGSGPRVAPDIPDPFAVMTVVEGAGPLESCRAEEGGEVHRFLECLARREALAGVPQPRALADTFLRGRAWRSGGGVLAAPRARVVWAPYRFRTTGRCRWLGCYHRNLTLSVAHTDAWIATVRWAASRIRAGFPVTTGFELAERVCQLLSFLYGEGERSEMLYRTRSAAAQIAESGVVNDLYEVRRYVGKLAELTPVPLYVGQQ